MENPHMPKRGAFALGLTALALVLLLNFQTPSLSPASATGPGTGGTGGGTGSTRTGGTSNGGTSTGGTSNGTSGGSNGTSGGSNGTGPTATTAGERTVNGPVVGTRFGSVQVEVTLDGTKIVDITALQLPNGDRRTDQISSYVEPILRTEALQAQSANIDGISGATYTSNAYARSLQAALDSAGI
jgi:FMN-binding domain